MDTQTTNIIMVLISCVGILFAFIVGHANGADSVHKAFQTVLSSPDLIAALQARNNLLPAPIKLIEKDAADLAEKIVTPPMTISMPTPPPTPLEINQLIASQYPLTPMNVAPPATQTASIIGAKNPILNPPDDQAKA